jgi:hypothetical protein
MRYRDGSRGICRLSDRRRRDALRSNKVRGNENKRRKLEEQSDPPARTNAFVAYLFRMQAQVLETALAVQLAQNTQHLAARQGAQIADP